MDRAPALLLILVLASSTASCSGSSARREIVPGTGLPERGGAHATTDRLPSPPDPVLAPAPAPAASARPPPNESLQACIDRQLALRGVNGFGDVPGTTYPHGPPVPADSLERYDYVLRRFPDLRTVCEASTPFR